MPPQKFLRIADIAEVTPSGMDGHQYQVSIQVGELKGGAFQPTKDHVVTVQTSGTLQAIWGQTDAQVAQSSLSSVTSLVLKAIAEDELEQLSRIQLNSYTAPKTPPTEPVVMPGTLLPVVTSRVSFDQPRSLSILSEDAAEKRDQINAIAQVLIGERLFELPQERSILAIYRPTRTREEFRDRIQALAHLCTSLNKSALGRYLGKEDTSSIGTITLLEELLAKASSPQRASDICLTFKNINELRKGYPTHGDNTEHFLRAHDFFRIPYPIIDHETSWDTILGRYFKSLGEILDVLGEFRQARNRDG